MFTMFMSREVNTEGGKPRPPVPPRPNKHVLDEALLRYKAKTNLSSLNRSDDYLRNDGFDLNSLSNSLKHCNQTRTDLGQHVHENKPHSNGPTVLLISDGKTLLKDADKGSKIHVPVRPPFPHTELATKIIQSNWYQVEEESGRPVKYSSCQITLDDSSSSSTIANKPKAASMSSLQGLPPLPKSLSGINLMESVKVNNQTPVSSENLRSTKVHHPRLPTSPPPPPPSEPKKQNFPSQRKMTTLDTQLAILRKEMYSLRELDLSLLSQLWSLNESIQEFRQMQEAFSPPSPSSDNEDDVIYSNLSVLAEHQPYPLSSSSSRSSNMDLGDV